VSNTGKTDATCSTCLVRGRNAEDDNRDRGHHTLMIGLHRALHAVTTSRDADSHSHQCFTLIIIIIIADNKSLQHELTSPLTIMQLDKIVKI